MYHGHINSTFLLQKRFLYLVIFSHPCELVVYVAVKASEIIKEEELKTQLRRNLSVTSCFLIGVLSEVLQALL